ncbi:hypothetical protein LTR17_021740 [Elasticomyces elasticus]|nr:hypothetical protein LTR17_021740 [Elasticomyces elasticus]
MEYSEWVDTQTRKRIARETQRANFMTYILKHNGGNEEGTLLMKEMVANAQLFLAAGLEKTATMLSATTFQLLRNPQVMQRLKDKVRGRWKSYSDITLEKVDKAPYLIAVLSKGLRYFPPVPAGFERRVGRKGGEIVSGVYLPENTSVSVSQYPAHHSPRNFNDPKAFVPERWMGDPKYASDNRASYQPFSYGLRNCIGTNLAYAEMRLIMAKMMWSFDLESDPSSAKWMVECEVKVLWVKPEMKVWVKEVVRS